MEFINANLEDLKVLHSEALHDEDHEYAKDIEEQINLKRS